MTVTPTSSTTCPSLEQGADTLSKCIREYERARSSVERQFDLLKIATENLPALEQLKVFTRGLGWDFAYNDRSILNLQFTHRQDQESVIQAFCPNGETYILDITSPECVRVTGIKPPMTSTPSKDKATTKSILGRLAHKLVRKDFYRRNDINMELVAKIQALLQAVVDQPRPASKDALDKLLAKHTLNDNWRVKSMVQRHGAVQLELESSKCTLFAYLHLTEPRSYLCVSSSTPAMVLVDNTMSTIVVNALAGILFKNSTFTLAIRDELLQRLKV